MPRARGEIALAGLIAADALRVAAWRPRWAAEVDDRALPHEFDWLRTAVHLSKGCYRGQETVAKVHNLGHPPRRLVALSLDGSDNRLPVRGAAVSLGGDVVGHGDLGRTALRGGPHRAGDRAAHDARRRALVVETEDGPRRRRRRRSSFRPRPARRPRCPASPDFRGVRWRNDLPAGERSDHPGHPHRLARAGGPSPGVRTGAGLRDSDPPDRRRGDRARTPSRTTCWGTLLLCSPRP